MMHHRATLRCLALAALVGMLLAAHAQSAWAQSEPLTLTEYVQALADASELVAGTAGSPADSSELVAGTAGSPAEALTAARRRLAGIDRILLPSGQVVSMAPLLPNGEELRIEDAQLRLALMQSQLAAAANDRTAARLALLAQVLARPELAAQETPWQRLRRWLAEQLARWLPDAGPARASSPAVDFAADALVWAVGGIGLLLLAALLSYWLQGLLRSFVADTDVESGLARDNGRPASPGQAREQAASFARAGDYRQAVRQLYLVALLTLEERGLVHRNRSLTNREVLAQVDDGNALVSHLAPVVDTFDTVWYGIQEPTQTTYQEYAHEIDALTDAARRGPRPR